MILQMHPHIFSGMAGFVDLIFLCFDWWTRRKRLQKKKDKTMASLSCSTGPVVLKKRVSSREKSRSENYKVAIYVCAQIQVISSSFNSLSPRNICKQIKVHGVSWE
jgi:hypothetical protein